VERAIILVPVGERFRVGRVCSYKYQKKREMDTVLEAAKEVP
jgi:hypothetical protein